MFSVSKTHLVWCATTTQWTDCLFSFFKIANTIKKWKNMCYLDEISIILLVALPKWFFRFALSSPLVFLLQHYLCKYQRISSCPKTSFCNWSAYYSDICVGAIACRLEKKEGGAICVYIMTLGVLAPYRGLGIGEYTLIFPWGCLFLGGCLNLVRVPKETWLVHVI